MSLHRTPLVIPWWTLHTLYGAFFFLGMAGVVFGSPTLDLSKLDGLTALWGWAAAVSALVALIGSLRDEWETIERWGVLILDATVVFYAANAVILILNGTHPPSSTIFTVIVLVVSLLPVGRGISLLLRAGLRK